MFAASKTASVSGGYQISRSLRFNSADSAYLNRTPASATNRKTWTLSLWLKRSELGKQSYLFGATSDSYNANWTLCSITASDQLYLRDFSASAERIYLQTNAVLRDVSAWYHIVVSVDTTQATSSNRVKLYINNVEQSLGTATYPSQNIDTFVDSTNPHTIGVGSSNTTGGYITEFNFIDGQALTPSSFGETNAQTGVWQPKAYAGSYGTNGFYLNFSDNSNTTAATLGKDYSGNGNNWTPNNFSVTAGAGNDSLVDSPTSYGTDTGVGGTVRGNYATWNPLSPPSSGGTYSNGNLDCTTNNYACVVGNFSMTSGQWYWEVTPTGNSGASGYFAGGVSDANYAMSTRNWQGANGWYYYENGKKYNNGTSTTYGSTYTTNDVIGVALDMDAGTLTFYKNGVSQGVAFTGLTGKSLQATVSDGALAYTNYYSANFGQRPFAYTAPSGYKALCTQNLPTPTIGATTATQAGKYFNPVLYTGNSSTNAITGVGFQPDLTWFKRRDAAYANVLQNSATGVTKYLVSNTTDAEGTYSGYIQSWNSDGFTLGSGDNASNNSGSTYVAWNWKANGSGSTNTAGSITSTVSVNTTSGFSIVTFTGTNANATVGHGLGVAPAMVIMKNRAALDSWQVYHISLPSAAYRLQLNSTAAADSQPTVWNSTAPSSTVFSVGTNVGNYTQIAYCFAEVAGYSKFGSYTGNGSTDGPFVFCGFRPAYVLLKSSTEAATNWEVYDNKRSGYNNANDRLYPNLSNAEDSSTRINLFSNGFQLRAGSGSAINSNGQTYIFMAVAENPFKYSLAR